MKKRILSILVALMLMGVLSCSGSSNTNDTTSNKTDGDQTEITTFPEISSSPASDENTDESTSEEINITDATTIVIGNNYSTSKDIELNLYKIITSNKIQCVSGEGSYYEASGGTNYVDIVLNVINRGNDDLTPEEDITAYFISSDNTKYEDVLIAVETSEDWIDRYGKINPLSNKKVHIGYELPTNIKEGKGYIQLGEDLFSIEYDVNVEVSSKISVSMGQEIKAEDVASFKLVNTEYTTDVLPSKTSGYYTHYPIDDPANDVYFVVYCDLTNISTSNINADDMISIRAIFDGKYEYKANMALEEKDGTGFDYANITSISPLETRKGVFMFEVPKSVKDMSVELSIYFYGNEYSYTK